METQALSLIEEIERLPYDVLWYIIRAELPLAMALMHTNRRLFGKVWHLISHTSFCVDAFVEKFRDETMLLALVCDKAWRGAVEHQTLRPDSGLFPMAQSVAAQIDTMTMQQGGDETLVDLEQKLNEERLGLVASLRNNLQHCNLFGNSLLLRSVDLLSDQHYFSNQVYTESHQSFVQAEQHAQQFMQWYGCLMLPHASYAMDYQLLSLHYVLQLSQLVERDRLRPFLMRYLLIGRPVNKMAHLTTCTSGGLGLLEHLTTVDTLLQKLVQQKEGEPRPTIASKALQSELVDIDVEALRLLLTPLLKQAQADFIKIREDGPRRYYERLMQREARDQLFQQVFLFAYEREPAVDTIEARLFWWQLLVQTLHFYTTMAIEKQHYLL
jgi:hypothetical protein